MVDAVVSATRIQNHDLEEQAEFGPLGRGSVAFGADQRALSALAADKNKTIKQKEKEGFTRVGSNSGHKDNLNAFSVDPETVQSLGNNLWTYSFFNRERWVLDGEDFPISAAQLSRVYQIANPAGKPPAETQSLKDHLAVEFQEIEEWTAQRQESGHTQVSFLPTNEEELASYLTGGEGTGYTLSMFERVNPDLYLLEYVTGDKDAYFKLALISKDALPTFFEKLDNYMNNFSSIDHDEPPFSKIKKKK